MVADTYSARLGLLEMGTGNQNNSWGISFNASVTDIIDRAIAGVATHVVTGGTLDLSGSPPPAGVRQDVDLIQNFAGVLTSNQTIIVPNISKTWLFANFTTGAFQFFVKTAAGTAVQVPQGTTKFLICFAGDVIKRFDEAEVGAFQISGKAAVGAGELLCNGASLLRTDYPDLYSKIATTWGSVDGTHFTLPNFTDTNRYLRASGGGLATGTYQANQNKAHTHTGSGTTSTESVTWTHTFAGTTATMNSNTSHSHTYNDSSGTQPAVTGGGGLSLPIANSSGTTNTVNIDHTHGYSGTTGVQSANHTHTYSFTTSGGSADGSEARPESAAVLICIKY